MNKQMKTISTLVEIFCRFIISLTSTYVLYKAEVLSYGVVFVAILFAVWICLANKD